MRILVTGANGHIGANTVRSLLQRGYEVVAFVRQGADLRGLDGQDVTLCYGDIRDASSLVAAAKGCEVIVHCAAVYNLFATTRQEIVEPVLVGIENVFQAMAQNQIRRLVYTSSLAAVGLSNTPDQLRTPADWHDDAQNLYFVAKVESEKRAIQLAEQQGVDLISLCPTVVVGSYDYRVTPSTGTILALANGWMTTWEGGVNLVDVRDVAEAHAAAVTMGEPGQRYIIGGENIHTLDMGLLLEELTGARPDHSDAQRAEAKAVAAQIEAEARLKGEQPATTPSIVHELTERYGYVDTSLTAETFALNPRQAREVLLDCLRWLDACGLLETVVAT